MTGSGLVDYTSQEHDGAATAEIADQLIDVWARHNTTQDPVYRKEATLKYTECDRFRCFTASYDGRIAGFAYGMYNSQGVDLNGPGQTSSSGALDLVEERIPPLHPHWRAAFDISEVQVLEDCRGYRIATRLVLSLCASIPGEDPVVLCVEPDNDTGAEHVYQQVGFKRLFPLPFAAKYLPADEKVLMGIRRANNAADRRRAA